MSCPVPVTGLVFLRFSHVKEHLAQAVSLQPRRTYILHSLYCIVKSCNTCKCESQAFIRCALLSPENFC